MADASWFATALGLGAGSLFTYVVAKLALPRLVMRSRDSLLAVRLALAGAIIALAPALLLSLVVGGTLGGAWGRELSRGLGLGATGAPLGLALGVALVFAGIVLVGTFAGVLIARVIPRAPR